MTGTQRIFVLRAAALIVFVAVVVTLWMSPLRDQISTETAVALRSDLRSHWYGPLLFIAAYMICATLLVPASIFVLSAGYVWGGPVGGTIALIGGTLGASTSYLVARFIGADLLHRFGPRIERLGAQLSGASFSTFLIVRVIPVLPYAMLNYGAGVARIRFGTFVLGTLLGLAPATYVFAWSADALLNGRLSGEDAFFRVAAIAAAIVVVAVIPSMMKRRAAKALARTGTSIEEPPAT